MAVWRRKIAPLALGTIPALVLVDIAAAAFGKVLPASLHLALFVALVAVAFWGALPYGPWAARAMACAFALVGASLYFVPFGPRKDFVRRVDRILGGMPRAEVLRIMEEKPAPHPFGLQYTDEDHWYEFDGGDAHCIVHYGADGNVSEVKLWAEPPLSGGRAVVSK